MKVLACRDAGYRDCKWEARGGSDDEVLNQARRHGEEAHGRRLTDEDEPIYRALIKTF